MASELDNIDLVNGKRDIDHIADLANSPELVAEDRHGNVKRTWAGIEKELNSAAAVTAVAEVRNAYEDRVYPGVYSTPPTHKPHSGLPSAEGDKCSILVSGVPYEHLRSGGGWVIPNVDAFALQQDSGGSLVGFGREPLGKASSIPSGLSQNKLQSSRSYNIFEKEALITSRPTPAEPRSWNWSPAFQGMNDTMKAEAEARGGPIGMRSVEIPGMTMPMRQPVKWWVMNQMKILGSALFDFRNMDNPGVAAFTCDNDTTIPWDNSLKFAGSNMDWIGEGSLGIIGPGSTVSTADGMRIGNFTDGPKPYRTAGLRFVFIGGFKTGLRIGNKNTYLMKLRDMVFENNERNLATVSGTSTNSGERMEYQDIVFGPCTYHVTHDIDAHDMVFSHCSFDFASVVLVLGSQSRFSNIKMTSGIHIEAVGDAIVDATAKSSVNRLHVVIDDAIILPRGASGQTAVNSASRTLFKGPHFLTLGHLEIRFEQPPYLEDGGLIADDVEVLSYGQVLGLGFPSHLSNKQCMNADWDFQRDAVGVLDTALSCWTRRAVAQVASSGVMVDLGGKKVLQVTGTSGNNTSSRFFESKQLIACRPNDMFLANLALQAPAATGAINVQAYAGFLDANGGELPDSPVSRVVSFGALLANTTLPNYAEGTSRFITTTGQRCRAPAGAAFVRMRWGVSSFDGNVNFSRARLIPES